MGGVAAAVGGSTRGLGVGELDDGEAVGELEALLQGVGQPGADIAFDNKAIDDDVDVMGELLVERLDVLDLEEFAVDLDPLVALLQQLGQFLLVLTLAAAHERRQHVDARAFGEFQHAVDHLADGLAFDGQARRRRIGDADARPQQAHVVVDLGDGADGRARVLRRGLLLDGDGRRQAVDLVDVRLLHHLQELAGVGRQGLDIAALALGVDGVEGERRLAGTRQPGEHHELVARDADVDVLEIVLAGAADGDGAGVAAGGFRGQVGHEAVLDFRGRGRCGT